MQVPGFPSRSVMRCLQLSDAVKIEAPFSNSGIN